MPWLRGMAVMLLIAAAAQSARAQELPNAPQAANAFVGNVGAATSVAETTLKIKTRTELAPAHRFFDRISLLSTAMETAGLLADGITTQNILGQVRTENGMVNGAPVTTRVRFIEADPIGKPFANAGWPGLIAGGALTIGSDLGVRYWLHRTNHHRLERIVPFLITATNTFAAIHNSRMK